MRGLRFHLSVVVFILAGLCLLGAVRLDACSTFVIRDGSDLVFGKNFDFFTGLGVVVVNKRGVSKTGALTADPNPAKWVSRYGSITFNQVGREYPFGGMNEAGLVIEQMWLDSTQYPEPDGRPATGELQWIQYQLDNFASVAEVIASDSLVRIQPGGATLHYLACDRSGNVATVEFVKGEMVAHTGEGLPVPVLTNDTYEACVAYLSRHLGFGGEEPIRRSYSSEDRFVKASSMVRNYAPGATGRGLPGATGRGLLDSLPEPVRFAFSILDSVAQGDATRWSIVYDIARQEIHFRTPVGPEVKTVGLADFDFSCETPVKILNVNARTSGRVGDAFADYSTSANLDLVRATFQEYTKAGFFGQMPDEEFVARFAAYPQTLECAGEPNE